MQYCCHSGFLSASPKGAEYINVMNIYVIKLLIITTCAAQTKLNSNIKTISEAQSCREPWPRKSVKSGEMFSIGEFEASRRKRTETRRTRYVPCRYLQIVQISVTGDVNRRKEISSHAALSRHHPPRFPSLTFPKTQTSDITCNLLRHVRNVTVNSYSLPAFRKIFHVIVRVCCSAERLGVVLARISPEAERECGSG